MSAHPTTRPTGTTRTRKPANETKKGNILLRSRNGENMLRVLALASEGWVRGADTPGYVGASMRKFDGSWHGDCTREIRSLLRQGLVFRAAGSKANGHRTYYLMTNAGWDAMYGALRATGRSREFPGTVVAEVNGWLPPRR